MVGGEEHLKSANTNARPGGGGQAGGEGGEAVRRVLHAGQRAQEELARGEDVCQQVVRENWRMQESLVFQS